MIVFRRRAVIHGRRQEETGKLALAGKNAGGEGWRGSGPRPRSARSGMKANSDRRGNGWCGRRGAQRKKLESSTNRRTRRRTRNEIISTLTGRTRRDRQRPGSGSLAVMTIDATKREITESGGAQFTNNRRRSLLRSTTACCSSPTCSATCMPWMNTGRRMESRTGPSPSGAAGGHQRQGRPWRRRWRRVGARSERGEETARRRTWKRHRRDVRRGQMNFVHRGPGTNRRSPRSGTMPWSATRRPLIVVAGPGWRCAPTAAVQGNRN